MVGLSVPENSLSRQAGTKIALIARHDSKLPRHVVIDFTATPELLVIHCREVMLHVDPLTDNKWTSKDTF